MASEALEELKVIIEAQTRGFREEMQRVQDQVTRATSNINKQTDSIKNAFKGIIKVVAGLQIAKYVKESVTQAMQVEGAIQQIKRTMGESSQAFLKWGKDQGLAFNLAQSDVAKFGAVYSNLLSGFMGGTQNTMKYTEELLKASSIIASGTGRSMEDVMERIRSGMLGNTEAIEDLGINVNVAMLQSTDAFKRFAGSKSWDQLDYKTQQQIRLFAILEQTGNKFGDSVMNNTNSSLQQLVAILKDVGLNIGNAFLPILNVVLPILSNLALYLRTATAYLAQFMQALFGKPKSNPGESIKNAGVAAIGATGATNDYNTALANTGSTAKKTAKEVNRLLGGFDEINSLNNSGADGGGLPGAGLGGNVPGIDVPVVEEPDVSGISAFAEKVKAILEPLKKSFNGLMDSIRPVVKTIGEDIMGFYNNVLVPFGTWTISEALPAFFNLLSGVFDILNPLMLSFRPLATWLWENFLAPIAAWTGGVIVDVLNGIASVLKDIGEWMSNNQSVVDTITTSVIAFFVAWKLTELMAFIQMSGGIVGAFTTITTAIKACTFAKLADNLETIALTVLYAKDFVMSIVNGTVALVKQAAQFAITTGLKIADTVAQVALTAATIAWNVVCGIATIATTAFGIAMAILTSPITLVIVAIGALIAAGVWLYKNWDEVKANLCLAFDRIGDKFSQIFDAFSGIAKGAFNGVIGVINWAIGKINRALTINVPDWDFLPDDIQGKSFGLTIPKIPYLAKGGIVDSATIAMVGEAGKEAVMPLENNTGWITDLAQKVSSRMPEGSGSNNSTLSGDIIFQIDGSVIGKVALAQLRKMQRQGGITLIPV